MYLVSWLRFSCFSNIPKRFNIIEKCFFVAVVTVLITAPSNKEGDEELRLLDMKWSCLKDKVESIFSAVIKWRQQTEETFLVFFLLRTCEHSTWYNGNTGCTTLHTELQGSEQLGHYAQSSDSYSAVQTQLETVPTSAKVKTDKVYLWLPRDTHKHTQAIYLWNQGCLDT